MVESTADAKESALVVIHRSSDGLISQHAPRLLGYWGS